MTPIWRYLTQPAGMTAQKLADATGLSIKTVRDDLAKLETQGKACRERGPVGTPHKWWRVEKRPLSGLDVLLCIALAATNLKSSDQIKEVLADVGSRARSKQVGKVVAMCAMSRHPRQVIWEALDNLEVAPATELRAA